MVFCGARKGAEQQLRICLTPVKHSGTDLMRVADPVGKKARPGRGTADGRLKDLMRGDWGKGSEG